MKKLFATYLLLMALLTLTVIASLYPLGVFALPVSLAIATIKAAAVAWIFMDLLSSQTLVRLAAGVAFFWLAFFYILSATDTFARGSFHNS